jgi:hypothetical protein
MIRRLSQELMRGSKDDLQEFQELPEDAPSIQAGQRFRAILGNEKKLRQA